MAARNAADFADVSDDGDRVRRRRERLGIDKLHLAKEAGVSRETLAAVERGEGFRRSTLTKLERVLAALEEEAGFGSTPPPESRAGEPHMVTIRGTRAGDVDVVVSGPIDDIEKLAATVERLLLATEKKKADEAEDGPK